MKSVAEVGPEVKAIRAASAVVRDLAKGGPHMRRMGKTYLPKFAAEEDDDYRARLESTWLFDGVGKTIEDMTGKVFARPVVLAETGTDADQWVTDIDLEGRDLSRFARDVFETAQRDGISFIMADAPVRSGDETKAQAAALNIRPYLVHLTIEDVLGWRWSIVNGSPMLTQFRIMESVTEVDPKDEFKTVKIPQVRVLDLPNENGRSTGTVGVRIYRKVRTGQKEDWALFEEYSTGMGEIMVAPVDLGRKGFFDVDPVHGRLAEINAAHWRIQSDKASCLHKSLSPLLFMKNLGLDESGDIIKSAGYGYISNNEGGDMKWVEITGNGIEAARQELKDLELQMQAMGLQLVMSRTGTSTATGDAIDESKGNSRLAAWADILKDALELSLGWMMELGGIDPEIEVEVNKDYAASTLSHVDMVALAQMHLAGVLSKRTYIMEARRRGILAEGVDPDEEADLVEDGALDQPGDE